MSKIQIMLVEDHPEYREIIELTLKRQADMELVGEFGTVERALHELRERRGRRLPDVILLDLNLPGISGLDAIPHFLSAVPSARIMILTQSDREADVMKAIMLGASGYLLKSSTAAQLSESIRSTHAGGAPLDPAVARYILTTLQTALPKKQVAELLTDRETEVLTLLAEGLVKKEIADRLEIGHSTVVTHVAHIYEKLNVQNAPSAIARAFRLGILKD